MHATRPADDGQPSNPPLWEQVAAGFILILLTGAFVGPVFAPDQGESPVLRLVWLPVYAITAAVLVIRYRRVAQAWPAWMALLALIALTYASRYWSIDPSTTTRRVIAMALSGCFSVYLGAVFHGVALPRLFALSALLMGVGSIIMVFAFPAIGVHHDVNAGLWRGLWYEKNQMGIVMVAGATAAAAWLAAEDRIKLLPLATLGLASLLVLATQSKTSLLCLMLGVGLVGGLWAMRKGGPAFAVISVWLAVVGGAAGVWLWNTRSAAILGALGKDPSLTGRTEIWSALMREVAERPWTGYGYNAFWGKDSVPAMYIRLETGWAVPSAHNGWIDLLIQLGWPGAILVGALVLIASLSVILRLGGQGRREGGWSLAYLAVFFLLSLSESILLSHTNLPWALFVAILARVVTPDPVPARVSLAPRPRPAYLTGSRIAAHSGHGPARRPLFL